VVTFDLHFNGKNFKYTVNDPVHHNFSWHVTYEIDKEDAFLSICPTLNKEMNGALTIYFQIPEKKTPKVTTSLCGNNYLSKNELPSFNSGVIYTKNAPLDGEKQYTVIVEKVVYYYVY